MLVTYKLVGNCGFHIEISYETNIYVGMTPTERRMGNNGKNIPNVGDEGWGDSKGGIEIVVWEITYFGINIQSFITLGSVHEWVAQLCNSCVFIYNLYKNCQCVSMTL